MRRLEMLMNRSVVRTRDADVQLKFSVADVLRVLHVPSRVVRENCTNEEDQANQKLEEYRRRYRSIVITA